MSDFPVVRNAPHRQIPAPLLTAPPALETNGQRRLSDRRGQPLAPLQIPQPTHPPIPRANTTHFETLNEQNRRARILYRSRTLLAQRRPSSEGSERPISHLVSPRPPVGSRVGILRSANLWTARSREAADSDASSGSLFLSDTSTPTIFTNPFAPVSPIRSPLPVASPDALHSPFFPLSARTDTPTSIPSMSPWDQAPSPIAQTHRRPVLRRMRAAESSDLTLAPSHVATPAQSTTVLLDDAASMAAGMHEVFRLEGVSPTQIVPPTPQIEQAIEPTPTFRTPWPHRQQHPRLWAHWPSMLFAISVVGTYAAGLGATWLERGIYATQPLFQSDGPMPPGFVPDRPRPDLLGAFPTPTAAIVAGATATAIGLALSFFSAYELWNDSHTLASRKRAVDPRATWRPNIFASINALNIPLWWAYRFRAESTRDHADKHAAWLNAGMGAYGAAVFAGVQSIALSSSELLRADMLPRSRLTLNRVALGMVGMTYPLYAHFVAEPNSSAELRSSLRVWASASMLCANTVVLTHMRRLTLQQIRNADIGAFTRDPSLAPPAKRLGFIPSSFYPITLLGAHAIGRLLIHVFSVPWAQLYHRRQQAMIQNGAPNAFAVDFLTARQANSTNMFQPNRPAGPAGRTPQDLPNTLANLGIAFSAIGTAIGFGVTYLFAQDARKVRRADWPYLTAAAVLATVCVVAHRVLNEDARNNDRESYELISVVLGCTGYAAEFVSIVSLFAYSQMRNGRPAWPWVDHLLQTFRATGDATLHMWAMMAADPHFNPIVRATSFTVGTTFAQLGLAIPTGVVGHAQAKIAIEQEHQHEQWQLQTMMPSTSDEAVEELAESR